MATRMQQRRGTAAQWTENNPVLGPGEIGFETDANKFKIGDGINNWADLSYFLDETALGGSLDDYVPNNALGVSVATLVNNKVPSSQLPDIDELSQDAVNQALTAGTGITKSYNDAANTLTVAVDTATIATRSFVTTEIGNIDLSSKQDVVSGVSSTEIGYLDGVTSNIQTQLNNKLESSDLSGLATETFVGTAVANLVDTAPAALNTLNELAAALGDDENFATTISTSLGNKQDKVSGVSDTEIGYLDGVTSAIQTQIDGKASLTGAETFTNKTLNNYSVTGQTKEDILTSATGFAGYTYNVMDDGIQFITANATANGTINFRGNGSTTMNSFMSTNHSVTCVLLVTNGATPYRPTAFQIDGTAVTPKWQGGTAPSTGNANSIDAYTFTIIKTASATYTVLASQTRFA
jgi:hypothetical protein